MEENFKTLIFVKSSLVSLYVAITLPIPYISDEQLKIYSIIAFVFGLIIIISITNDFVKTCETKISYRTSYVSRIIGKKGWEIFWKDIKLIKSFPTSQGSKVHYFVTNKDECFLVPQRIQNLEKFVSTVSNQTGLKIDKLSYISPLWTYKLLTYLSVSMIIGEILAFSI